MRKSDSQLKVRVDVLSKKFKVLYTADLYTAPRREGGTRDGDWHYKEILPEEGGLKNIRTSVPQLSLGSPNMKSEH